MKAACGVKGFCASSICLLLRRHARLIAAASGVSEIHSPIYSEIHFAVKCLGLQSLIDHSKRSGLLYISSRHGINTGRWGKKKPKKKPREYFILFYSNFTASPLISTVQSELSPGAVTDCHPSPGGRNCALQLPNDVPVF